MLVFKSLTADCRCWKEQFESLALEGVHVKMLLSQSTIPHAFMLWFMPPILNGNISINYLRRRIVNRVI